ncbi:MAG: hypothetical protein GX279_05805 [Clostridiaceae bacterium]|jgi:hypothetical protein|nr:hypothetical protein [Clostridiaceae bacterium]
MEITRYGKCNEEKSKSSRSLTESSGATARLKRSREQTAEDGLGAIHGEQAHNASQPLTAASVITPENGIQTSLLV